MPKKNRDEDRTTAAGAESPSSNASGETVPASPSIAPQDEQIAELRELTRSLIVAVNAMQTQSARNAVFQDAVADVQAATRAILVAPATGSPSVAPPVVDDCGESTKNCCMQIFISRIRALKSSIAEGDLEVIVAVKAGGQGTVFPSLTAFINLDDNAIWTAVDVPVGRFCVPCAGSLTIPLTAEALEVGKGAEGRPEFGATPDSITLTCSCPVIPRLIKITLSGKWGLGHGNNHEVEVEISGRRLASRCC